MAKHTVKGFITYEMSRYSSKPTISFTPWKPNPEYFPNTVIVGEHSIEVEVPDDFNPVPAQIAVLNEKKRLLRLALAEQLKDIDEHIGKLQAITYEPAGVQA